MLDLDFPSTTYTNNHENSLNIKIGVWDKDYIGLDDLIGTGTLNLMELASKGATEKEIELPIKLKGRFTGIVNLSLSVGFNDDKEWQLRQAFQVETVKSQYTKLKNFSLRGQLFRTTTEVLETLC